MTNPNSDGFHWLTEQIIDAFEESGASALDITDVKRQSLKFLVGRGSEYDRPIEVWIYAWFLERDHDEEGEPYRIALPASLPGWQTTYTAGISGTTIVLGYEPDLQIFVGFGFGRLQGFPIVLSDMRISVELLHKGLQEGMTFGERHISESRREVLVVFRPDLLMDYVLLADDMHGQFASDNAFAYMSAFSVSRPEPPVAMLAATTPTEQATIKKVGRRIRDKNASKKVVVAYEHRCAVTRMRLRLVDAAHIYPAKEPDSSDDITNRILLSPTIHRAFDRGLIYLDTDYVMRINEKKVTRLRVDGLIDGIKEFRIPLEKKIHLPADSNLWPSSYWIEAALDKRRIRKIKGK